MRLLSLYAVPSFKKPLLLTVSHGACLLPTNLLGDLNFQAEKCPLCTSEPYICSSEVHVLHSNSALAMFQGRTLKTEFCLFCFIFYSHKDMEICWDVPGDAATFPPSSLPASCSKSPCFLVSETWKNFSLSLTWLLMEDMTSSHPVFLKRMWGDYNK